MLIFAIITASCLLALIVFIIIRAVDYLDQHPELITDGAPLAYERCHVTLNEVIARFQEIKGTIPPRSGLRWQAFNGRTYAVSTSAVEEQRDPRTATAYRLGWAQIGGVGIRMQPGFTVLAGAREHEADSTITTGYSFHLLIVPTSGSTIDIPIPTSSQDVAHHDAVEFVAYTLALAEEHGKRINVFGFDKPPAPYRQKVSRL
jgi:hypothetical protein